GVRLAQYFEGVLMTTKIHAFKVGQISCTVIQDGGGASPVAQFAGIFPYLTADEIAQAMLDVGLDPNANEFSMNVLLIDTGSHRVLVDTGNGPASEGRLLEGLETAGIAPDEVDTVILTHGHPDHIGGIVDAEGELLYPNARHVMWKSDWQYWLGEANKSEEHFARRSLFPLRNRIDLIELEAEITPGICAVFAPGPTPGHMALLLETDGERLLHIADTVHIPVQITRTEWSPRYDFAPDKAADTRRRLIERAAREKLLVMAYHLAFPGLGRVVEQNDRWLWQVAEGS
ncbi:MAG: MBL fold metallo-hydrolase, partial [Candidatus Methanoperedens sp.]|nr:MBL fold metallo-hydrolase [Candidatus Methanoperedens sp.]